MLLALYMKESLQSVRAEGAPSISWKLGRKEEGDELESKITRRAALL